MRSGFAWMTTLIPMIQIKFLPFRAKSVHLSVNLPRGPLELLWKLWKMQAQVDQWQTTNEERILCEVYAKLLGVLLQHWLMLLTGFEDPHRSAIGVSEIIRDQVVVLAHGFAGRLSLRQALHLVSEAVKQAAGRSIAGRSDRPSTSRLLLAFGEPGLT